MTGFSPFLLLSLCLITIKYSEAQSQKNDILYSSGEFVIYKDRAIYKNKEIYNARTRLEKLKKMEADSYDTTECPVRFNYYYNPLSLAGKYYSYEYGESGYLACGPPSGYEGVNTRNLETGQPVYITELVTEASLHQALIKATYIREYFQYHIDNNRNGEEYVLYLDSLDSSETLAQALDILSKNIGKREDFLTRFALVGYNRETNEIVLRIVLPESMPFSYAMHLQIELLVIPHKDFEQLLLTDSNIFYLGRFANGLEGK